MVHLPGAKKELTDWLSRTEFDSKFGLKSEVESHEAFSRVLPTRFVNKTVFQAQCPIPTKNCFPEFNLDDHDDDQIKAVIAILSPHDPQVIEGKLWYKTDKELFCERLRVVPVSKVPQELRWTHTYWSDTLVRNAKYSLSSQIFIPLSRRNVS